MPDRHRREDPFPDHNNLLQDDHPQRARHPAQEPAEPHHGLQRQPAHQERPPEDPSHQGPSQQHQQQEQWRWPEDQQWPEASGPGQGESVLLQAEGCQAQQPSTQRLFGRQGLLVWFVVLQAAMAPGPGQQEGVPGRVLSDQRAPRNVLHVLCECADDHREALSDTEQDYRLDHVSHRNRPNRWCSSVDLLRWAGT